MKRLAKTLSAVSFLCSACSFAAPPAVGDERLQELVRRFPDADLNHDGKLSLEEFIATASDKGGAKTRFENFDADKDGFISREEFMKGVKK